MGIALWLALAITSAEPPLTGGPYCIGQYADGFEALSSSARELEQKISYTFCVRTAASYECPFYGPDGSLRRTRKEAVAHGTAFAYRRDGKETLLLTNEHVAHWPAVTDEEHTVEGVPVGCRRVSESARIVDDERDAYERDDVPLAPVVSDPELDVSVMRARVALPVMPWKIGRSAALRVRNVVETRGFPLGKFKANNVGKVISAYDHDDYKDWDHDDFVIDALLSSGNSGSPVLAVSCRTGEFELVGIYHAAYSRGSALNVVVAIDQVRDLMIALKRSPARREPGNLVDARARKQLFNALGGGASFFFPFGELVAAVDPQRDGALLYRIHGPDFPFRAHPVLVLEDRPVSDPGEFGELARVWFGSPLGLRGVWVAELDADAQRQLERVAAALRRDGLETHELRVADKKSGSSREAFQVAERQARAVKKGAGSRKDLAQMVLDLAEARAPKWNEPAFSYGELIMTLEVATSSAGGGAAGMRAAPQGER